VTMFIRTYWLLTVNESIVIVSLSEFSMNCIGILFGDIDSIYIIYLMLWLYDR